MLCDPQMSATISVGRPARELHNPTVPTVPSLRSPGRRPVIRSLINVKKISYIYISRTCQCNSYFIICHTGGLNSKLVYLNIPNSSYRARSASVRLDGCDWLVCPSVRSIARLRTSRYTVGISPLAVSSIHKQATNSSWYD